MVEIEKVSGLSMDIEQVEKDKLKSLFPQCFIDGKLDIDKLLSVCGEYIDNDFEKYKFEWSGKSECYKIAGKRSAGTLRPCPQESVKFDTTGNLYIEGDNLEVLKLLQTAYFRKVKMIYIDPPYNTGNDFVYEDDFKDPIEKYKEITSQTTKSNPETMGRFHTNWLNMMYPRLRLAANLLRDDGVIFISIDDNEVHNLRKVCDEVFGEENFVASVAVQVNPRGRHLDRYIAKTHEYLIIYCKNYEEPNSMFGAPKEGKMIEEYNYEDERGKYRLLGLRNRNQSFNPETRPNLYYPLYVNPKTKKVSINKDENHIDEVFPDTPDGIKTCWTWSNKKVMDENILITAEKTGDEWRIYRKDYMINEDGEVATTLLKSLWAEAEINNDYGRKIVKELFGSSVMDFPKSVDLIKKTIIAGSSKNNNDIILDFFSGSATTAHAVMQLNAEDGGNRKFIMVQLPEICDEKSEAFKAGYQNICEIGKERIRRAGTKIQEENEKLKNVTVLENKIDVNLFTAIAEQGRDELDRAKEKGLFETVDASKIIDTGFKVLKLDSSNLAKWDNTPIEDNDLGVLFQRFDSITETIKKDRSDLDVVYEVMLKMGVPLDYKVVQTEINGKRAYSIGEECLLLVCLDGGEKGITPEDIEAMCEFAPAKIIASEEAFADDTALSNAHYILKDRNIEMKLL